MTEAALEKIIERAIAKTFEAQREPLQAMIIEALEDAALVRAMDVARDSPLVSRDEMMHVLRKKKAAK